MTPYIDFLYFGISLYVLLPNLIFGWVKRLSKIWIVIATLFMLVIQYGVMKNVSSESATLELWMVLGYALFQYLIASLFLLIRRKYSKRWVFYLTLLLTLLPLLGGKFIPLFQPSYGWLFLGLSYLTFRSLDVIFGIQDEIIHTLSPIQYFVFLLFFPSISSGPIDRYQRFKNGLGT